MTAWLDPDCSPTELAGESHPFSLRRDPVGRESVSATLDLPGSLEGWGGTPLPPVCRVRGHSTHGYARRHGGVGEIR